MNIIRLASKNIRRNRHRTLVTMLAMSFACVIMIVYSALMKGMVAGSERQAVVVNMGDIQIHAKGYRDDPDIYSTIHNTDSLISKIHNAGFLAAPRQYGFGLIVSDDNSSGAQLRGIDLALEATVTQIHLHILQGSWLDKTDPRGVVIGKKMARLLNVTIGSELIFVGQTSEGFIANDIFKVKGILKSISSDVDNSAIFMSNNVLATLLTLSKEAHEIVIMRQDRNNDLIRATQSIQTMAPDYEVLNWQSLNPVIARFLETADVQTMIMMIFTYIAVASVVLNAMLMSVFERIREFGIMKAIGVTPLQTILLVYAETFLLTLMASFVALGSGWWAASYLQQHGLDMSSIAGNIAFAGIALDPIWYALITPDVFYMPIIFLFAIAAIAVLYPAVKVARLKPINAIHHH